VYVIVDEKGKDTPFLCNTSETLVPHVAIYELLPSIEGRYPASNTDSHTQKNNLNSHVKHKAIHFHIYCAYSRLV
jgi:hypothetical protein